MWAGRTRARRWRAACWRRRARRRRRYRWHGTMPCCCGVNDETFDLGSQYAFRARRVPVRLRGGANVVTLKLSNTRGLKPRRLGVCVPGRGGGRDSPRAAGGLRRRGLHSFYRASYCSSRRGGRENRRAFRRPRGRTLWVDFCRPIWEKLGQFGPIWASFDGKSFLLTAVRPLQVVVDRNSFDCLRADSFVSGRVKSGIVRSNRAVSFSPGVSGRISTRFDALFSGLAGRCGRAFGHLWGNGGPWSGAAWPGREGGGSLSVVGVMCVGWADGFHFLGSMSSCGMAAGAFSWL